MFGSIEQGLRLLGLGSAAFTTGSDLADGGTTGLAFVLRGLRLVVEDFGDFIGS